MLFIHEVCRLGKFRRYSIQLPPDNASDELKAAFLQDTIGHVVDKYVMVEFADEKSWEAQQKKLLEEKKSSQ